MKFIEQYNNEKNIRYNSYKFALSEAYKRNHKILCSKPNLERVFEKFSKTF